MANRKTAANSFTTTYSIDPELYEKFRRIAEERENRSARQQVRHLIAEYVTQQTNGGK
jgi:hypothetical protein